MAEKKKYKTRTPLPILHCDFCNKKFQPNRSWQKFCPGGKCKDAFRKRKQSEGPIIDALSAALAAADILKNAAKKAAKLNEELTAAWLAVEKKAEPFKKQLENFKMKRSVHE